MATSVVAINAFTGTPLRLKPASHFGAMPLQAMVAKHAV